jgi:hypothetical protein
MLKRTSRLAVRFALPLPLATIGASTACGSAHDAAPPAAAAPDPQPFIRTTQASPATKAELGVTQWWAVYDPSGRTSVGGLDASNTLRVAFNSSPTQWILQDTHGTFEIDVDGTKVVSSTFDGNAGALRTLALIKMDLAPSNATTTPADTSAATDFGPLHLTDTSGGCPKGTLIADCAQLFDEKCSWSKFDNCMHDAGSLASTQSDISACVADWSPAGNDYAELQSGGCGTIATPACFHPDWTAASQVRLCLDGANGTVNRPSYWQGQLNEHGCFDPQCEAQWHIGPETLLNCPQVDHFSFVWLLHVDTCTPVVQ